MENWWVKNMPMPDGEKVLGPFASRDLAFQALDRLERDNAPKIYWVDHEPADDATGGVPPAG